MLICICCVIFITRFRVSFCIKLKKKKRMKKKKKKDPKLKSPEPEGVQGYWLNKLTTLYESIAMDYIISTERSQNGCH